MTLAMTSPREFAFAYGGQGFTAVTRGEVVYLAKCHPVLVTPDLGRKGCFNEMPVYLGNKTMFMTPRSRILIPVGTSIDCLPDMMPKYNIDQEWYHVTSHGLMSSPNPYIISPDSLKYKFKEISDIPISVSRGGLYHESTMEKYQKAVVSLR